MLWGTRSRCTHVMGASSKPGSSNSPRKLEVPEIHWTLYIGSSMTMVRTFFIEQVITILASAVSGVTIHISGGRIVQQDRDWTAHAISRKCVSTGPPKYSHSHILRAIMAMGRICPSWCCIRIACAISPSRSVPTCRVEGFCLLEIPSLRHL